MDFAWLATWSKVRKISEPSAPSNRDRRAIAIGSLGRLRPTSRQLAHTQRDVRYNHRACEMVIHVSEQSSSKQTHSDYWRRHRSRQSRRATIPRAGRDGLHLRTAARSAGGNRGRTARENWRHDSLAPV